MSQTDDRLDEAALDRMWPRRRYGAWGDWFQYVGRTRQQRDGLVALRLRLGPRGKIVLGQGGIRCRSTFAGEFEARDLEQVP